MGHVLKELKIMHINVQGIYTSRVELDYLIQEHEPHILTLNETHLKPHNKLNISQYNILRKDRHDRAGGGVAILVHDSVPGTPVPLPPEFSHLEALQAQVHIRNFPLHVSTIYKPPNSTINTQLIHHLSTKK